MAGSRCPQNFWPNVKSWPQNVTKYKNSFFVPQKMVKSIFFNFLRQFDPVKPAVINDDQHRIIGGLEGPKKDGYLWVMRHQMEYATSFHQKMGLCDIISIYGLYSRNFFDPTYKLVPLIICCVSEKKLLRIYNQ